MSELSTINSWSQKYDQRLREVSWEYWAEVNGWQNFRQDSGKSLPYVSTMDSLLGLQSLGSHLYHNNNTVRSVIEKCISYVVSKGHSYDVTFRNVPRGRKSNKIRESIKEDIYWAIEEAQDSVFTDGWQEMQEETHRRYLRDGEAFRRIFSGGRHIRFVEPWQVRSPPDRILRERTDEFDVESRRDHIFLGVEFDRRDATQVVGYWVQEVDGVEDSFVFVPSYNMQHIKYGVDSNDPRGVTPFWLAHVPCERIDKVSASVCELVITQSEYAVIRNHTNSVSAETMRNIARGLTVDNTEESGYRQGVRTKEVDAKGFTFEFPAMNVDPSKYISIIDQEEAFICRIVDMPHYMISARTPSGSRSSNVSADGPFSRRTAREQKKLARYDIELLWRAVSIILDWGPETFRDIRERVKVEADYPIPYSRDMLKDSQAVSTMINAGVESLQGGSEKLGNDYSAVRQQRKEEGLPLAPVNQNSKTTSSSRAPDTRLSTGQGVPTGSKKK